MSKFQHDVMLKIVKIIDLIMITIPFALCWELYYSYQVYAKFGWRGNWTMIGLFAVLFFLLGKVYDAFWMSLQRISELIYGQVLAAMATDGILYIVICLMARRLCNLLPGIAAIAGQVVMTTLWARCAHTWYFRTFPPQPTAVVYDVRHGLEKLINEYGLSKKYDVKMTLNVEECLNDLSLLDGMQSVFISGVHSHERNIILKYCVGQGINVFVIPRVGDVIMSGSQPMHMFHLPVLRVGRYMASPEYLFVKRLMDIVVSLAGLVILSPLLLITAIAVKSDGGPAFYKQVRLTKDGKQFEILKFRSMRVDAEKDGVARLSTGDKDDRITKVGHIIRACRLDELPQLLNILKGDLSIVGPRPERPEIAAQYCEEMPEFALRLQAKAGLTGYAQVYGKYNTTPYDKLQMDLMYIAHPSLIEDLKIMLATVKILFMPESTEGVAEGATTAMGQNYSVLMSVYYKEKPEYLEQAIESVQSQTFPTDDFILVCDGPLNDALDKVIAKKQREMGITLNVVRLAKNGGLGNALNEGIKHCKNELVARMDSDDIAYPDRCEKQLAVFNEHPEVSICSGIVEEFTTDPNTVDAKRVPPETNAEIVEFAKNRNPFNHPCVMYKKSAVEAVGSYQDFYLLEDYYLWLRMLMAGYQGYNIQEPLLHMRAGSDMYKRRAGWKYAKTQARLFKFMKQQGFIGKGQYMKSCVIRSGSALAPNWLRRFIFEKVLRK